MQGWGLTDVGCVRKQNQDAFHIEKLGRGALLCVVCDGMGGVNGGNIASSVACDAICKAITENYTPDMEEDAVRDIMLHAINDANAAVLHRAQEDPALNGMGTTVVVSIAAGGVLHIAHAGDSRCYLKTALGVKQVTTDHSFVQQLVESGAIDCIWGCFSMSGRENDYQWAGPYAISRQVIAVDAGSDSWLIARRCGYPRAIEERHDHFRSHVFGR